MVGHAYKENPRDLRKIEEQSPENFLESALAMTLIVRYHSLVKIFYFHLAKVYI